MDKYGLKCTQICIQHSTSYTSMKDCFEMFYVPDVLTVAVVLVVKSIPLVSATAWLSHSFHDVVIECSSKLLRHKCLSLHFLSSRFLIKSMSRFTWLCLSGSEKFAFSKSSYLMISLLQNYDGIHSKT